MDITFLGTRGFVDERSKAHNKRSALLLESRGKKLLIDWGDEYTERELRDIEPDWILITHWHPDHAFGLDKLQLEIPVYVSEDSIKSDYFKEVDTSGLTLKTFERGDFLEIGPFKIQTVPVLHSVKAPNVALFIEADGIKFCYASDVLSIRKADRDKYLRGCNFYVGDLSTDQVPSNLVRKHKETGIPYGHADFRTQLRWARDAGIQWVLFTHLGSKPIERGDREMTKIIEPYALEYKVLFKILKDGDKLTTRLLESLASYDVTDITPKVIRLEPEAGIILVPPHGQMAWTGEKRAIVKSIKIKKWIGKPLHLIERNLVYGVIKISEPVEIDLDEFKRLYNEHRVSEAEREEWWPEADILYYYKVTWLEKWPRPVPIKRKVRGPQVFIDRANYEFVELTDLDTSELLFLRAQFKARPDLDIIDLCGQVEKLLLLRGITPDPRAPCKLIAELIKDWRTFDPRDVTDQILLDDHRIACAMWPLWFKRNPGKKFESEQFKDLTREEQIEVIRDLCAKIQAEMRRRGMEPKIKFPLVFEPEKVTVDELPRIDFELVKELSDEELKSLDLRLHELYEEMGVVNEDLSNAHIAVWNELRRRGIGHPGPEDELYWEDYLEVVEYPAPPIALGASIVSLEEVLKHLPEQFSLMDPPAQIWLVGGIVNRGWSGYVDGEKHDIDIVIQQRRPDRRIEKELLSKIKGPKAELIKDLIHFVFTEKGPSIGLNLPLYRLSYQRVSSKYVQLEGIEPGKPVHFAKPRSGFGKYEFWDVQESWDEWAKDRIAKGLIVQEKLDGMSFQVHFKRGELFQILTEDKKKDRVEAFKKSVREFLEAATDIKSMIAIVEMVEYDCSGKRVRDKRGVCTALPREDMVRWVGADPEKLDDQDIVFHIHDLPYLNGEVLTELGYTERMERLAEVLPRNLEHWRLVPWIPVKSKSAFLKAVETVRRWPGSEGAVIKEADMKYELIGRTSAMMKIKNMKELDVMVWRVIQKKTKEGKPLDQWVYDVVVEIPKERVKEFQPNVVVEWKGKYYTLIGTTYSTAVRAKKGEIIEARVIRIRPYYDEKGLLKYTWMFPVFVRKRPDKEEPDTLTTVERIVRVGTHPLSAPLRVLYLPLCELVNSPDCPFFYDIAKPWMASLAKIRIMRLKYPVKCAVALFRRCPLIKSVKGDRLIPILKGHSLLFKSLEELWEEASPLDSLGDHEIRKLSEVKTLTSAGWRDIQLISRHQYRGEVVTLFNRKGETCITTNHPVFNSGSLVMPLDASDLETITEIPEMPVIDRLEIDLGERYTVFGDKIAGKRKRLKRRCRLGDHSVYGYCEHCVPRWIKRVYESESEIKDLLRVLAFYITEGTASKLEDGRHFVTFSSKDKEALVEFRESLLRIAKLSPTRVYELNGIWLLSITNQMAYDFFTKLCGKGSENKMIPSFVFNLPRSLREFFLEELIRGNGTRKYGAGRSGMSKVSKGYFQYGTVSKKLAAGLVYLTRSLGRIVSFNVAGRDLAKKPFYLLQEVGYFVDRPTKMVKIKEDFEGYVYDVQTETGDFYDAVGLIRLHNSYYYEISEPIEIHSWSLPWVLLPEGGERSV